MKNSSFFTISDTDIEVDRDEDTQSPQPHHVHYNGRDGHYLEIPSGQQIENVAQAPAMQPQMSLPGSPQKKYIAPILESAEEERQADNNAGEDESSNSGER